MIPSGMKIRTNVPKPVRDMTPMPIQHNVMIVHIPECTTLSRQKESHQPASSVDYSENVHIAQYLVPPKTLPHSPHGSIVR